MREIAKTRDTIVVVTSDHGDEFVEHGLVYHNNLLIEELIRIPMVMWGPNHFGPGTKVETMVRQVDVLPTLAEMIGASLPPDIHGSSLMPLLRGEADDELRPSFAEGDYCTAYVLGDWKVMYVDSTETAYLYNLQTDPNERNDLATTRPDKLREMMVDLEAYLEEARKVRHSIAGEADEEVIRQLKAHGYL